MADEAEGSDWKRELLAREPIFDHPEYIWDEASFEAEIAPDFAEIGASGAWHRREDIKRVVIGRLAGTEAISLVSGYRIEDPEVVRLSGHVAQVRYTLHGQDRVTRRTTLYRRSGQRWQAIFHQGTIVQGKRPLPPTEPEPRHG